MKDCYPTLKNQLSTTLLTKRCAHLEFALQLSLTRFKSTSEQQFLIGKMRNKSSKKVIQRLLVVIKLEMARNNKTTLSDGLMKSMLKEA